MTLQSLTLPPFVPPGYYYFVLVAIVLPMLSTANNPNQVRGPSWFPAVEPVLGRRRRRALRVLHTNLADKKWAKPAASCISSYTGDDACAERKKGIRNQIFIYLHSVLVLYCGIPSRDYFLSGRGLQIPRLCYKFWHFMLRRIVRFGDFFLILMEWNNDGD